MLRQLVRFEWRYHTRQPSFFAAAALFFVVGFALAGTGFGPKNVVITSPYVVTETLGVASLLSVFAIAIFVANAVIRDREHRFEEIVFTTPIGRANYLLSRYGGALAASTTAMALAPLGMLIATRMPWIDAARVGAFQPLTYLWAFVTLVVPTLIFTTALLFALAAWTRSALATYTASVAVYFLYLACAALTDSPLMAGSSPSAAGGAAAALLDPFGLSSFFELTRYWTIAEKNHRFVPLGGVLLVNRALWLAAGVALCALTLRTFTFRLLRKAKERKVKRDRSVPAPVVYSRVDPSPRTLRTAMAAYRSAAKLEIGAAMRSLPFLLLLALWFVLALAEIGSDVLNIEYGAAAYPATALIVATLQKPLWLIGIVLVIYYGAELFWREQRFRFASIVDATPMPGAAMVLAKWTALVAMSGATIAVGIAAGVATQLTHGWMHVEPIVYLSLFYTVGLPVALYAAAAAAIHALSPGKYAGLLFVLLFVVAMQMASLIGLEHPLWHYASGPNVRYSDLSGFSDNLASFGRLMLHWSVLAAALLAAAAVAWRRLRDRARDRLRLIARHAVTRGRVASLLFVLLFAATGASIFYDTNVRATYRTTAQRLDWREAYERRYRPIAAMPQPRIVAITTKVDLDPQHRRLHIGGDYTLVNVTNKPMTSVYVSGRDGVRARFTVDAARLAQSDAAFGMHRFDFAPPLAPGARTTLHFELDDDGADDDSPVVANGSLILSFLTYPILGYRAGNELTDPRERARRHLGPSSTPDNDDVDVASSGADEGLIDFDAVITTSGDQTAIAPGTLLAATHATGRNTFHYRAAAPIRGRFAIASARYAVAHRNAGGVDVSVAYDPAHRMNVDAILDTAVRTLAYCSEQFGRYPHRQLKLVEAPSSAPFGGLAFPDTILLSESRLFLVDRRDPDRVDLVARRVAHEVAHQWFGYQLIAAERGGALTLTESLTKYVELMLLERMHGRDHVRQLLTYELDRYLAGRARETLGERTLANVGDAPYLYYSKGALVFYAIRDLIGEAALNQALRGLLADAHGQPTTTAALLQHLRAASSDAQYALLDEWLERIVLYDLRIEQAAVTPLPHGRFQVTARIIAAKHEAAADGSEHEVPLDEAIDVALFRAYPEPSPSLVVIATQRRRLHGGANEVTFVVDERPAFISVDPWLLRINRSRSQAMRKLP